MGEESLWRFAHAFRLELHKGLRRMLPMLLPQLTVLLSIYVYSSSNKLLLLLGVLLLLLYE
jgi:hypothetical protein